MLPVHSNTPPQKVLQKVDWHSEVLYKGCFKLWKGFLNNTFKLLGTFVSSWVFYLAGAYPSETALCFLELKCLKKVARVLLLLAGVAQPMCSSLAGGPYPQRSLAYLLTGAFLVTGILILVLALQASWLFCHLYLLYNLLSET